MGSDAETPGRSEESEQDEKEIALEEPSSGSEDEEVVPVAESYKSLLQSLNANIQRGPPRRKKRKIDHEELKQEIAVQENGTEETENEALVDSGSDESEDVLDNEDVDSVENTEESRYRALHTLAISDNNRG